MARILIFVSRLNGGFMDVIEQTESSYQHLNYEDAHVRFALTCPFLLSDEDRCNPFLVVERFFQFAPPSGYRRWLSLWFKNALSEGIKYEKASDLLFMHNQFLLLINAGFLIASRNLQYQSTPNTSNDARSFSDFLVAVSSATEYEVHSLESHHRDQPLAYLYKTLNIARVTQIRFGLREWLETAVTENDSIAQLEPVYTFDLYELLQKITEAFYLVIIAKYKIAIS